MFPRAPGNPPPSFTKYEADIVVPKLDVFLEMSEAEINNILEEKQKELGSIISKINSERIVQQFKAVDPRRGFSEQRLEAFDVESCISAVSKLMTKPVEPVAPISKREFLYSAGVVAGTAALTGAAFGGVAGLFKFASPAERSGAIKASAFWGAVIGAILAGREEYAELEEKKKIIREVFLSEVASKTEEAAELSDFFKKHGVEDPAEIFTLVMEIVVLRTRLKELKK